ncbi:MAG: type III-B CRISPR module RAMP protein Cmr6 [Candidatus Paceibacterota bacterium]
MTDSSNIQEPFCPLFREAIEAAPWKNPASAHAGLLFDKFADAWRYKKDRNDNRVEPVELEFDKGYGQRKEGANEWINRFQRSAGNPDRLAEACRRQRQMVTRLGGKVLVLTNPDRFVTGMGREHPLENGFAWHHTLGVPYLPGSSLKGMLAAWLREETDEWDWNSRRWKLETNGARWFGTQGQAGQIIFFDMLPLKPPTLCVDVMTPHYGPYYLNKEVPDYQNADVPGDWHSPVPITFLTVAPDQSWQLGIVPAAGVRKIHNAAFAELVDNLREAIEVNGAGAKTAIGYGRFARDAPAEDRLHREADQERAAQEQAEHQAAEQAQFEASLADDSEPLKQLKTLRRDQNWQLSAADQNMMRALEEFSTNNPEPPHDCLDWIRELLESIPNYKGVWGAPEATREKAKKPKPKYNSTRIREIVKHLNSKLHE